MQVIELHGAVSRNVVEYMAKGAKKQLNTDYGIATSGIAGPNGGTTEKPVGTVWIAAGLKSKSTLTELFYFSGSRSQVRNETVNKALQLCEKVILS